MWTRLPDFRRADAGRGVGGAQSPPHLLSPIMGTLRTLGPKGPKRAFKGHKSLSTVF